MLIYFSRLLERSLIQTEYVKKGALSEKKGGSKAELYAVIERYE